MRKLLLLVCGALFAACSHTLGPQIVPDTAANDGSPAVKGHASSFRVLYNFKGGYDGATPGGLIDVNGTLYGTSGSGGSPHCKDYGCGTVFRISTDGTERVLYSFTGGKDGSGPAIGGLTNVNGTLYGTTTAGGGTSCFRGLGCGVVFSITTAGKMHVLYRFQGGSDGASPGALMNVN